MQKDKELFDSMRNIVILNSLHFSYPLPILMRVSYNTLIVKQNTSDYYKYMEKKTINNWSTKRNPLDRLTDKRIFIKSDYLESYFLKKS